MIRPYPTVRISGSLTKSGARRLAAHGQGAQGRAHHAHVRGQGLPAARGRPGHRSSVHIQQFERELRAGIKLTITVAKPGYITKVTTIKIRKGKAPVRSDAASSRARRSCRKLPEAS